MDLNFEIIKFGKIIRAKYFVDKLINDKLMNIPFIYILF